MDGVAITLWDFTIWLPSIILSSIITVVGFLGGTYYKARVEKNLAFSFDKKIEPLRSDLRKGEEQFKFQLRASETQLSALRDSALASLSNKNAQLDRRRIEAAERLWTASVHAAKLKFVAKMMQCIKIDGALERSQGRGREAESLRSFAQMIWDANKLDEVKLDHNVAFERPFLSPKAWVYYSAYISIYGYAIGVLGSMKAGLGKGIMDETHITAAIQATLPHHQPLLEKYGSGYIFFLIDELEEKLLAEIVSGFDHSESTSKSLAAAAEIVRAAENANRPSWAQVEIPISDLRIQSL